MSELWGMQLQQPHMDWGMEPTASPGRAGGAGRSPPPAPWHGACLPPSATSSCGAPGRLGTCASSPPPACCACPRRRAGEPRPDASRLCGPQQVGAAAAVGRAAAGRAGALAAVPQLPAPRGVGADVRHAGGWVGWALGWALGWAGLRRGLNHADLAFFGLAALGGSAAAMVACASCLLGPARAASPPPSHSASASCCQPPLCPPPP